MRTLESRLAILARRAVTLIAVVTLLGSIATTQLGSAVALARPVAAGAPPPSEAQAEPAPTPTPSKKGLLGRLNLNTATPGELELLPGIGPTKADKVIAFRAKNGPFKRVQDLRRVKGFGRKTVDRLTPLLTVTEKTTLRAE